MLLATILDGLFTSDTNLPSYILDSQLGVSFLTVKQDCHSIKCPQFFQKNMDLTILLHLHHNFPAASQAANNLPLPVTMAGLGDDVVLIV